VDPCSESKRPPLPFAPPHSATASCSKGRLIRWESLPSIRSLLAQYLFDSLHDRHFKIFLVAAKIGHLAHIFFEGLKIKDAVVEFGIVITAEPRGDEPRLTDFVMHELVLSLAL
jgi:hypothetical protein